MRNPALDGLRGVAALFVLFFHTHVPGFRAGDHGVIIFFVLSGYVITDLLVREWQAKGSLDLARFYGARVLRLMPPLIFFLVAYVIIVPRVYAEANWDHVADAALAALYLTDVSISLFDWPPILAHTWSLSIEFHYYLIWPLLLPWLLRQPHNSKIAVLAALYVAVFAWREANEFGLVDVYIRPRYAFEANTTGLILGSMLALSIDRIHVNGYIAAWCVVALIVLNAITPAGPRGLSYPFVELATAGLIAYLVRHPDCRPFASQPLLYLGTISYAIYLWHYPATFVYRQDLTRVFETTIITLIVAIGAASVSWFLIEWPAMKLRRRLRQDHE